MEATARKRRRKKKNYWPPVLAVLFLVLLSGFLIYYYFQPGLVQADFFKEEPLLILGDQVEEPGSLLVTEEGQVLVSLSFFLREVDPRASWDPEEKTLSLTSEGKLIRMNTEQLTAYINTRPVDLSFPLQEVGSTLFLPLDFLLPYYPLQMTHIRGEGEGQGEAVLLDRDDLKPLPAVALEATRLREHPSLRSPYYIPLEAGSFVDIFSEEGGWYRVRSPEGLLGYIPKEAAQLKGAITLPPAGLEYPRRLPWRPMGERVNLTWEFAYSRRDTGKIPPMPGVNVVSPTWFHLQDEEGNLRNLADPVYVSWAHGRGYRVWALVTNKFDKDLTRAVLKSPAKRQKVIDQLLIFTSMYDLDGINIDFENMHPEDRDLLTQFMRELTPLAHEQGLTVSIDVTMISGSPNWSLIYDRPALAEIVDYVALMAYDEHWGSSPVAGPVASLPWVEKGLQAVLEEVPAEKLLLGIPLYARLWKEEMQEGGGVKVSANAYSMGRVQEILKREQAEVVWDNRARQNYAEYQDGEVLYRVWIEDEESIRQRVELVNQYNLAGIASWRRGLEDPEIWDVIHRILK